MALAMSIKESKGATPSAAKANAPQDSGSQQAQPTPPVPSGTTAATVSRVRALFDFQPSEPGELQFKKGDIIAVLESVYKDWWKGSLRGQTGIFPLNYVEKLQDPTREELEKEAQTEADVFAQIRNVEKLLALLSTNSGDGRDSEEITELYHSTLAIRPKLIELIGKYSQKKGSMIRKRSQNSADQLIDDFTQLNEKFIKARRDYESLLEASMTQPPQPAYGGRPYGGYNAPPPSNFANYPPTSPPAQQDPRFGYGGGPPAQSAPFPPAGTNPAFFMVPPGDQRPPQQTPQPAPVSDPYAVPAGRVPVGGRPQSYGGPQELSTGHYDSPIDNRQSFAGPSAPQTFDYPPSNQQPGGGYPPQQQGAPGYPPQGQQSQPQFDQISSPPPPQQPSQQGHGYPPSQPGYAPPAPPGASTSPAPPQSSQYLPYRPPGGQAPSAPPVGGDEGFYR